MKETFIVQNTRRSNPFATAFIGLLLFLGSFVLIYKNEGRINLAVFADKAVSIVDGQSYTDGQLVALTGDATTTEETGDGLFKKPERYVSLERSVLMYAWEESSHNEDNTTRYTYETIWTSNPQDSSKFEIQDGHENPKLPFATDWFTPAQISVGTTILDSHDLSLPSYDGDITLDTKNTNLVTKYGKPVISEDRSEIYIKNQNNKSVASVGGDGPLIGDIRVSYHSVPIDSHVTVFGAYSAHDGAPTLIPYIATQALKDSTSFYHMRYGDKPEATKTLGDEYTFLLWILRGLGFIFMLSGFNLILYPLKKLLGYIPLIGQIGNFVLSIVAFLTVVVLYLVTLFVAVVLHSVIALVITAVVVIACAGFILHRHGLKKQNQSITATSTTTSPPVSHSTPTPAPVANTTTPSAPVPPQA